jgi:hypothetical protein
MAEVQKGAIILTIGDQKVHVDADDLSPREWKRVRRLLGADDNAAVGEQMNRLNLEAIAAIAAVIASRDDQFDATEVYEELLDTLTMKVLIASTVEITTDTPLN